MGNSIAKNLRVSDGLPSVTAVRQRLMIIQGYEPYFNHFKIISFHKFISYSFFTIWKIKNMK